MVRSLISAASLRATLIRMMHLLEGSTYFDLSVNGAALIRGWRLFETKLLLEEIRYLDLVFHYLTYICKSYVSVIVRSYFYM